MALAPPTALKAVIQEKARIIFATVGASFDPKIEGDRIDARPGPGVIDEALLEAFAGAVAEAVYEWIQAGIVQTVLAGTSPSGPVTGTGTGTIV